MKRFVTLTLSALFIGMVAVAPLMAEEGESGQALYDKKCAMCHGKDGVAKKMAEGSANLNDPAWQKATTLEAIIEVIAKGKGKMPKNEGKLTPDQIKAIAEYTKTLK
jgi:mono/diheme cytochrome c family protein